MTDWRDTDYYTSAEYLGATASAVTVSVVGALGMVTLLLVALGLWRQAVVRARAAFQVEKDADTKKLRQGFAVVHGQVETDDGEPAVRIVIRQQGQEYTVKNGTRHRWTEVDRSVVLRPFFLTTSGGERVKVEPGENAFVVDLLDIQPGESQRVRLRSAEIRPKDFVYASGILRQPVQADAYRSAEQGWTLRPGGGQRMLLSTEPLDDRFRKRARFHGGWALGLACALLFTNGVLFNSYWNKLIWGRTFEAVVVSPRNWTTQGKHGPIQHYGVTAQLSYEGDIITLTPETSPALFQEARTKSASGHLTAPFLVVPPSGKTYNIGTRPVLHSFPFVVSWIGLIGLVIAYVIHTRHTRPWYERKRVVDVGPGGLGRPDHLE